MLLILENRSFKKALDKCWLITGLQEKGYSLLIRQEFNLGIKNLTQRAIYPSSIYP